MRPRSFTAGAVLAMAVWAGVVAGQDAAPPAPKDVETLVEQLSSDNWQQRQEAQERLTQLGQPAVERLQALVKDTADPEVRAAAEAVLAQVALNDSVGPTLVTLKLEGVTPEQAFAELMRQAGAPLKVTPDTIWKQRQMPISIDIDRRPFWEAMRELGQRTGITVKEQRNPGELVLQAGEIDDLVGPTVHSGPFMIVANSASRHASIDYNTQREPTRTMQLSLRVSAEPKLKIYGRAYGAFVTEATDEAGNSLIDPAQGNGDMLSPDGSQSFQLMLKLTPPPPTSQRLTVLKGRVKVAAQVRAETLEVPDLSDANNLSKSVGNHQVLITATTKSADEHHIRVVVVRDGNAQPYWDRALDARTMEIYDANGELLAPTSVSPSRAENRAETQITVKLAGKNAKLGPPSRLVWTVPVEIKEMTVPFEFRDLPLP